MRDVGFIISHKENEKRRALVFDDLKNIKNIDRLYFETGYFKEFNIEDQEIINLGANVVSRDEILKKDIVCDPKAGDGDYLNLLKPGTSVWGWIHAVQNRDITDKFINNQLTAIAFEDMYEGGRHSFWRNNEIAGEAAIMHAYSIYGKLPYETKVALLGRGNTARGALTTLISLGAKVEVYTKKMEDMLRERLNEYDVIINCVLWDTKRTDHILSRKDIRNMKKDSMIIDISCDKAGGIETSIPTTIDNPVYYDERVLHYVVDHTPSILFKTSSNAISKEVVKYIDMLIEGKKSHEIEAAKEIINGTIVDQRIIDFQNR